MKAKEAVSMSDTRRMLFSIMEEMRDGKVSVEEAVIRGDLCELAISDMREEIKGIALYGKLKAQQLKYDDVREIVRG